MSGRAAAAAAVGEPSLDLKFKHCFGITGPVRDNVILVEKIDSAGAVRESAIFPVGNHVVMYDVAKSRMAFFERKGRAGSGAGGPQAVTALAISPNHKYLAVCEQFRESAKVSVFGVLSRKQVRSSLTHQSGGTKAGSNISGGGIGGSGRVVSTTFSGDSKHLVAVSADLITVWSWEKEKVEFTSSLTGEASRVHCPPFSTASAPFISTTGASHFRIWASTASSHERLKQSTIMPSQSKEQSHNFLDHAYLSSKEDRVVRIAVIAEVTRGASLDGKWQVVVFGLVSERGQRPNFEEEQTIILSQIPRGARMLSICSFASVLGFSVGGSNGCAYVYRKLHEGKGEPAFSLTNTYQGEEEVFSSMCPSLDDERIVLYSDTKRVSNLALNEEAASNSFETNNLVDLMPGGHHGAILDIDFAIQRPLFATCGVDKCVRIWNYSNFQCDISHFFHPEEPIAIAFHPSGYQLLVGFKDRIRLYNVLVEDISPFREVNCKSCRQLRFSHGGHMFAAALGSNISIYSTYQCSGSCSFQLLRTFNGHVSPINSLVWDDSTDTALYSTGTDGHLYMWDLITGERKDDMNALVRGTNYGSLVVDNSSTDHSIRAAACSANGILSEVAWSGNAKDVPTVKQLSGFGSQFDKITAACLSVDKKTLYAGTAGGCIRLFDWPICSDKPPFREYMAHHVGNDASGAGPVGITGIRATKHYLITTGSDGSIFLAQIQTIAEQSLGDGTFFEPDPRSFNNGVVLVCSESYKEQQELIADLERRISTLQSDHDFALHSKDSMWQGAMKELSEKTDELIEGERQRFDELQRKHEETIQRHVEDLETKDSSYSSTMRELEDQYEHRLAVEIERFDRLKEKMDSLQKEVNKTLKDQEASNEKKLWTIRQSAETKEKMLNATLAKTKEEAAESQRIFKEILDQQEEEYEMELMQLTAAAESKIHLENDRVKRMQGCLQNVSSRRDQLNRNNAELRAKTNEFNDECKRKQRRVQELENELAGTKDSLEEKSNCLKDKEGIIEDLKYNSNVLANSKCALENQVQNLRDEKEPMNQRIDELKREIIGLQNGLDRKTQSLEAKDLVLDRNKLRIKAHEKEIASVRQKVRERERELQSIKRELASLVETGQNRAKGEKSLHEAIYKLLKE